MWEIFVQVMRSVTCAELSVKVDRRTKAGVDEAVPAAAAAAQQPPPPDAGGEAERGSEQTHQHVADADVQQQHVHRRPQLLEFAKQDEHDKVVEEAEGHDEAQHHGQHDEARLRELRGARGSVLQLPVIALVEAEVESSLTGKHPAVHSSDFVLTFEQWGGGRQSHRSPGNFSFSFPQPFPGASWCVHGSHSSTDAGFGHERNYRAKATRGHLLACLLLRMSP